MKKNNQTESNKEHGKHEHRLPQEISPREKQDASNALQQADEDMQNDVEFSAHSPNDDLDEGETARLGEDKTDLI